MNDVKGKTFSLIFLDGSHEYDDVKFEVENYGKFLCTNGNLFIHDAEGLFTWHGSKKVRNELLKNSGYTYLGRVGSLACFKKNE